VSYNKTIYDCEYFSSLSTDNDSTLVWVGKNNKLYKSIISPTIGNRSDVSVSGLTSNSASGHQICYDSGSDRFFIASDEGFIYTYNKSTIIKFDTINAGYNCDSITSLSFSPVDSILYLGALASGENKMIVVYYDSANYGLQNVIGNPSNNIVQSTIKNDGSALFNEDTLCVLFSKSSSGYVDNLPAGTVVYDLDYIDYLPYIQEATYEGVMTVGFYDAGSGDSIYGYSVNPNFGTLTPLINGDYDAFVIGWFNTLGLIGLGSSLSSVSCPPFDEAGNVEYIEIDGIRFNTAWTGNEWAASSVTNPFPPIGETCTIKIKYTP